MNQFNHQNQAAATPKRVWFSGSTALSMGMGLCYDLDYVTTDTGETATDAWGKRDKVVALPSSANNTAFAGVVQQDYAAVTGGQWIYIYEPGSTCLVLTATSITTTIGQNAYLWCLSGGTDAGKFTSLQGFVGRGAVRVLQTISAAGLCLAQLVDGPESNLVEVIATATLTAGGAITCQVGGVTKFLGAATPASDCTFTLANGTFVGQRKAFVLSGALTTNDVLITVTSGLKPLGDADASSAGDVTYGALATMEFDGDGDRSYLEWDGVAWILRGNVGTALSAS